MSFHRIRSSAIFPPALLPLCVSLATLAPLASVQADVPAAQQSVIAFDLPAGKLSTALNALARQSGLTLSVAPDLLKGKSAIATRGSFTAQQALDRLLTDSGLTAKISGSAIVVSEQATTLRTMKVSAATLGSATEGSGSYTARAARSATGLNLSLRETPQSISVITHDRMEDQDLTDIADVMMQIVGVSSSSSSALGSDGTAYNARGFAIQNYLVDGVPRPNTYGFAEETADMAAYDRVEVVHGAAGIMTGNGVPAASVNLIRKRPTKEFSASVTAKTGSWDLYRLETDVGGALTEDGGVRGRVSAAYQENDSFIDREHAERKVFYGVVETDIGASTQLLAGFEYQDFENLHASRGGVQLLFADGTETDFSRSINTGADWSTFERNSSNVFVSLDHRFNDDWHATISTEHKDGRFDESIGYLYTRELQRDGTGGTLYAARWAADLEINAVSGSLQGAFDLFGRKHEVVVTAFYGDYKDKVGNYPGWWADDNSYYADVPNTFDFYATGDWPKPNLTKEGDTDHQSTQSAITAAVRLKPADAVAVILGSRVSNWKDHSAGAGNDIEENDVITPYVGVVYDVTKVLSIYTSYTSIFQPQTVKDVEGDRLDPLEGNNYEVGLKTELLDGRFNASAAVFRMEQDNFALSLGDGVMAPDGSQAYRAVSGAEVKGFELEVGGQVSPGWELSGGFTRADGKDNEGNPLQSNVPENTFKLFTTYQLRGALSGLAVGGNVSWQNETWVEGIRPDGSDYVQDSFTLVDLQARYVFPQDITLALHANNIFDKTYYTGLYAGGSRYGDPRNYSLSLRYDF